MIIILNSFHIVNFLLFPKSTALTNTMYNNSYNVNDQNSGYFGQFDPSNLSTLFTQSVTCDFDSIREPIMLETMNGSTSTGSSYIGSPSSPLSCTSNHPPHFTKTLFQRSLSSHSLDNNEAHQLFSNPPTGISNLDLGSVRRVSSAGDLEQGMVRHRNPHRGSPLANETTSIIIEGMTKPCRYSPDEKKERIEKYRSKRSQRNFNKKIQYACRKTLADSRPRVRGRFARNDELEKAEYSPDIQWTQVAGEEDEEDEEHWIQFLDSISPNSIP